MDILFFLVLGHFCGDYAFQSDEIAEKKKSSKTALAYHVLTYTLCIWMFLAIYGLLYQPGLFIRLSTILFLIFLFLEHWLQDFIKIRIDICNKQLYYQDQIFHIIILYLYRIFIYKS